MPPTTSSSNVVVSALDAMDKAAARDWANKTDAVLYPNITSNNTPEYDLGFYVLERVQLLADAQRVRLGHTLNAMLVECYFIGQPCTPESFSTLINWQYGNCYTFNSGLGNVSLNLSTSRSGPDFGLSLVLLVESEQQVEQLAQSLGIRLTVQEQLRVPFPEDNGLSMSTGSYWGVSVTRQGVDRLGDPYYTCANSRDDVAQTDLYQAEFPTSEYSRETCEKSTIQAAIIKRCLCADATYPRPNGTEFCSRFNQTQSDCVDRVQLDFSESIETVDCPPSCEQVSYEKLLHTATWPSEAYWNILRRKVAARFPSRNISNNSLAWARDNLVKVDIYYKELNFERIYQQANYPVEKLLSDIGGVFGFWTGFCILSFFEVFELLGLLLLQSAFFHPKVFKGLGSEAEAEANNGAAPPAGSPAAANTSHEFPSQMPPGTEWPYGEAKSPAGWQPFSYNKW